MQRTESGWRASPSFGHDLVAGAALHHCVDMPTVPVDGGQDRNLLMRQAGQDRAGTAVARRTVLRRSAAFPTAMSFETPEKKRLVDLDDPAQPLRLRRLQRGEQAVTPAPGGVAVDRQADVVDDLRQRRPPRQFRRVAHPQFRLPHPREGRAREGVKGPSAPLAVVGLEAAEALPVGAVAAMPDYLRAAAVRANLVVGDLDGAPGDQRFGHALGQQTRRLRLKIDQLIDRGVGGDIALQRLESGMVHAAFRRRSI